MKKFIIYLLTAILLIMPLTSCNGGGGGGSSSDAVKLDIDLSKKPELSILLPNAGISNEALNSNYNAGIVEGITGYTASYDQLPATEASTNLTTKFMDRMKFHAIKVTQAQFADLLADDGLLDLTAGLEKFAPNIDQIISDESFDVVTKDGKIYGIPERASSDNIEHTVVFRQDWLDELGLNVPETKEEFESTLKAIDEKYGKDKDGKDILGFYPFTFNRYSPIIFPVASAFGIYSEWTEVNGDLVYYVNMPGFTDYMEYIQSLVNQGLVSENVSMKADADCVADFSAGKVGAISTTIWSIPAIVGGLNASGVISNLQATSELDDYLGYMVGLENADGELFANRSSGYAYITVIPWYMGDEAGYAIDWMYKKLLDESPDHNFRNLVIGEEGVHFSIVNNKYIPTDKFTDKDKADLFLNGTNEKVYPKYWEARIQKNPEMYRAWLLLMEDADTIGYYNQLDFAPPLEIYYKNKAGLEVSVQDDVLAMMVGTESKTIDSIRATYKEKGGEESCKEVNEWFKNK